MFRQAQKTSGSGSQRMRLPGSKVSSPSNSTGSQAEARLSRLWRFLAFANRWRAVRIGARRGREAGKADWGEDLQHVRTERVACKLNKCLSALVLCLN